jgi:hypothetical protein
MRVDCPDQVAGWIRIEDVGSGHGRRAQAKRRSNKGGTGGRAKT